MNKIGGGKEKNERKKKVIKARESKNEEGRRRIVEARKKGPRSMLKPTALQLQLETKNPTNAKLRKLNPHSTLGLAINGKKWEEMMSRRKNVINQRKREFDKQQTKKSDLKYIPYTTPNTKRKSTVKPKRLHVKPKRLHVKPKRLPVNSTQPLKLTKRKTKYGTFNTLNLGRPKKTTRQKASSMFNSFKRKIKLTKY
mgnify:CR=1 FL=1